MALRPAPYDIGHAPDAGIAAEDAAALAERVPEIVINAARAARTIAAGVHGRRASGPGEAFWQFRPFQNGEPGSRVDWRRSGRDDNLYVREREWEAAHTLMVWADTAASMRYRSPMAPAPKANRAVTIALALAQLSALGGERAGWLGLTRPRSGLRVAHAIGDHLGDALARDTGLDLPTTPLPRMARVLVVSDFLGDLDGIARDIAALASDGARGHCVMVLDPIEESFPFRGRTEFEGVGEALRLTVGRAEALAADYATVLAERKDALRTLTHRLGWSFQVHHTDVGLHVPLLALHALLTDGTA